MSQRLGWCLLDGRFCCLKFCCLGLYRGWLGDLFVGRHLGRSSALGFRFQGRLQPRS